MAKVNTLIKLANNDSLLGQLSLNFINEKIIEIDSADGSAVDLTSATTETIVAGTSTGVKYVYISNPSATSSINLYTVDSGGTVGVQFGVIPKNQMAFFAVQNLKGLAITTSNDAMTVNYIVMTKNNS